MKRADILGRLKAGEELVEIRLPGQYVRYRLGQDKITSQQWDWLWAHHPFMRVVAYTTEGNYYCWGAM